MTLRDKKFGIMPFKIKTFRNKNHWNYDPQEYQTVIVAAIPIRDVTTAGGRAQHSDLEPTTDLSSSTQHSSVKNCKVTYNLAKFRQFFNKIVNFKKKIPTSTTRHLKFFSYNPDSNGHSWKVSYCTFQCEQRKLPSL